MPHIVVTDRAGATHEFDPLSDQSLMHALRDADIGEIQALCGGCCSCSTCHVYVEGGPVAALSPMSMDEDDLLDSSGYRTERSRLACQLLLTEALDGLRITVAPED